MNEKYTFHTLKERQNLQRAERLAYIDFRLRFMGAINRSDLTDLFGIADAAASKEITEYRELRPDNVTYDRALRANAILRETFQPLIDINSVTALEMLANGFNKNRLIDYPLMPYQRVGIFPNRLDEDIVSKITRSIHGQSAVKCRYISGTSKNHKIRTILPTAIFYDGHSWKFRAYNRDDAPEKEMFKCFNFSRLTEVEELPQDCAKIHESIERDQDWHMTVPIQLIIHPSMSESMRDGVKRDFGMSEDEEKLVVTEKAALVFFLVSLWNIDVGSKPDQESRYSFYLENGDSLRHIDSIKNIFK